MKKMIDALAWIKTWLKSNVWIFRHVNKKIRRQAVKEPVTKRVEFRCDERMVEKMDRLIKNHFPEMTRAAFIRSLIKENLQRVDILYALSPRFAGEDDE